MILECMVMIFHTASIMYILPHNTFQHVFTWEVYFTAGLKVPTIAHCGVVSEPDFVINFIQRWTEYLNPLIPTLNLITWTRFLTVSSVPQSKFWDSTLNQVMIASLHNHSNTLFINHLTKGIMPDRCINKMVDLKETKSLWLFGLTNMHYLCSYAQMYLFICLCRATMQIHLIHLSGMMPSLSFNST